MDHKLFKKVLRKIKHCEGILYKNENVKTTSQPSNALFIGNGGLGCGIDKEFLVEIFSVYGSLKDVVLLENKPYAFVIFHEIENSTMAFHSIFGKRLDSGHILYLSFILESDVPNVILQKPIWPEGLVLLKDFVSENQEIEMEDFIQVHNINTEKSAMKHRTVKHFGYEFIYGSNLIDRNKPLEDKIPDVCIPHLKRLVDLGYLPRIPEQLTVNHYLPGQGIPPHIDTHSCFEDGLVSISLGSQVVMEFSNGDRVVPVLLPRRSALIMLGESRYLWKHGITPRKTDIISVDDSNGNHLSIMERSARTSLTFRLIRDGECDCRYKEECDCFKKSKISLNDLISNEAEELEKQHVSQVYEDIANHFSNTRYKPWPKVANFLQKVPPGSFVLDIGCGNGKNLNLTSGCFEIGCDASSNLIQLCSKRNVESLVADCLQLPFRDSCVDVVMCIAVIHHLSTEERRSRAVAEILRILQPDGYALVYVWAFEQSGLEGPSKYLKGNKPDQSHQSIETSEVIINSSESTKCIAMPVHENRSNFVEQDILVPWKNTKNMTVLHRYYHVFVQQELEILVTNCGGKITSSYYDNGNWCVIFGK